MKNLKAIVKKLEKLGYDEETTDVMFHETYDNTYIQIYSNGKWEKEMSLNEFLGREE